jgi:hypothetical protein
LRDLDVDGRIILKWILKKWSVTMWIGFCGWCEHENKFSGSIKTGKFPDWLSDYQLLKKNSTSRN